jgi:hypothetical protein
VPDREPVFEFVGDLSDEAIEALAALLLSVAGQGGGVAQEEVDSEIRS